MVGRLEDMDFHTLAAVVEVLGARKVMGSRSVVHPAEVEDVFDFVARKAAEAGRLALMAGHHHL